MKFEETRLGRVYIFNWAGVMAYNTISTGLNISKDCTFFFKSDLDRTFSQ